MFCCVSCSAQERHGFQIVERTIDGLFITHILVNFRTALHNESSLVTDARVIAMTYIRGWFVVDVLASFPFDLLLSTDSSGSKASGGFRLARLLRLGRLVRVAAFGQCHFFTAGTQ